jgi:hypothetical protein
MKSKITLLTCVFVILVLISSCASTTSVAKKITAESGEIPPSMKTDDNFIIIGILKGIKSYDKYVKKEFQSYKGKYILATEAEIYQKYTDVNKYRYKIDYRAEETNINYIKRNYPNYSKISRPYDKYTEVTRTSTGFRYYIFDRKENKEYIRKSKSSFFAKEIRAYLSAIQLIAKSN